ncbi:hypothetical protein GF327_02335 [Candidatus Woesearchaeota archaeon]|nr:hypothetical protein [Candidatus Woesearchaeota archaeon]
MEQTKNLSKNWHLFYIKPFEYNINEIKSESNSNQKNLVYDPGMYSDFDYMIS